VLVLWERRGVPERSEVQIVISGTAVGLEEALKQTQAGLTAFSGAASKAGTEAGEHLAAGEHKAAYEAEGLGERAKVAAEMVSLLGAESSESVLKSCKRYAQSWRRCVGSMWS
jgi:ribosomal protein L12E/L44/L45/RPP1/RPP2